MSGPSFAFDVVDITNDWMREYEANVNWDAPHYYGNECVQVAVVQGINSARRRDPNCWYVMARTGTTAAVTRPDHLALQSVSEESLKTREEAEALRKTYYERLEPPLHEWSRESPLLREFIAASESSAWMTGVDEDTAKLALKQNHAVCVQAAMEFSHVLLAWREEDTQFTQIYDPRSRTFIDRAADDNSRRLYASFDTVLHKRPHLFFVGVYDKGIMSVYDVIHFPASAASERVAEFAEAPLIERLMHIEAILRVDKIEHVGERIVLAPFQPAFTRGDLKLHTKIFIDTCDFRGVVRRVSGASVYIVG